MMNTSNTMEHWRQAMVARNRMEMARSEYESHLWFARGCPMDRSGVMGASLLGSLKEIKAALDEATPGEGGGA